MLDRKLHFQVEPFSEFLVHSSFIYVEGLFKKQHFETVILILGPLMEERSHLFGQSSF